MKGLFGRSGFFLLLLCALMAHADPSLYERLGGRETLRPMVDNFVEMIFDDRRLQLNSDVKKYFDSTRPAELKSKVFDALCEATGGPCRAHASRECLSRVVRSKDLTQSDWDEVVANAVAAMNKFSVAEPERRQLRAILDHAKPYAVHE